MTVAPLLVIPEERKQQEIRRAMARVDSESTFGRRAQWLALLCAGWLLLGFGFIGLRSTSPTPTAPELPSSRECLSAMADQPSA